MRKALSNQQPGWAKLLRLCRHQQRDNATTSECHHCPTAGRRPDWCAPEPCFWIEEPVTGSDVKKSPRSPRFGNRNVPSGNSKHLPPFAEMHRVKKRWQKVIRDLVCKPCDRHPASAIPSHVRCCFHRNPNSLSWCCRSVQPAYSTEKPTPCISFGIYLRCFPKQTIVNNTRVLWLVQKLNEVLPCGCWPLIPCGSAGWGAPRSDFIQINQNTTKQNMSKIYIVQITCQLMCNRL